MQENPTVWPDAADPNIVALVVVHPVVAQIDPLVMSEALQNQPFGAAAVWNVKVIVPLVQADVSANFPAVAPPAWLAVVHDVDDDSVGTVPVEIRDGDRT